MITQQLTSEELVSLTIEQVHAWIKAKQEALKIPGATGLQLAVHAQDVTVLGWTSENRCEIAHGKTPEDAAQEFADKYVFTPERKAQQLREQAATLLAQAQKLEESQT